MPTLVITGHPSSGKTSFARLLADRAVEHPSGLVTSAVVINEESACPGRTKSECYVNSPAEKMTRAALKTEFDKYCTSGAGGKEKDGKTRLVILDSLNYIKGYRYELHCIAKAAGERHGVVWILNDPEVSKDWNRKRRESGGNKQRLDGMTAHESSVEDWYRDDEMMDELMLRYEPPDERNRWDKPLYKVDVGSILSRSRKGVSTKDVDGGEVLGEPSAADAVLSRTVYDMHSLGEAMASSTAPLDFKPASTPSTEIAAHTKSAGSSFRRSAAAAGFKRSKARGKAFAGATGLTAENLSSLGVLSNDDEGTPPDAAKPLKPAFQLQNHPLSTPSEAAVVASGGRCSGKGPQTLEEMADLILNSFLTHVAPLKQGMSTATHVTAGADVLHDVDSVTQGVITAFLSAQQSAAAVGGGVGGGKLQIPICTGAASETVQIRVNRTAQVTELKKLRRQYIKWVSAHPPEDASKVGIASSFLSYVESQL